MKYAALTFAVALCAAALGAVSVYLFVVVPLRRDVAQCRADLERDANYWRDYRSGYNTARPFATHDPDVPVSKMIETLDAHAKALP